MRCTGDGENIMVWLYGAMYAWTTIITQIFRFYFMFTISIDVLFTFGEREREWEWEWVRTSTCQTLDKMHLYIQYTKNLHFLFRFPFLPSCLYHPLYGNNKKWCFSQHLPYINAHTMYYVSEDGREGGRDGERVSENERRIHITCRQTSTTRISLYLCVLYIEIYQQKQGAQTQWFDVMPFNFPLT